jgi:membrane associated rhomboid family serine protease
VPEAGPELSVVCKSCGSEVSPYVTECPYCGTRLRKRAPKLERRGDELTARESRRTKRRRRVQERRAGARERTTFATERPYATIAAILGPAILLLVQRSSDLSLFQVGALSGIAAVDQWWNYLAAPFVYDDLGYLFVIGLAMALFVPELERRLGSVATVLMLIACGALGALAAPQLDDLFGDGLTLVSGGNGIALGALGAWFMLRRSDAIANEEDFDWIPVTVGACVLLLLPLVNDFANPWVGIVGGLVGMGAGVSASRANR